MKSNQIYQPCIIKYNLNHPCMNHGKHTFCSNQTVQIDSINIISLDLNKNKHGTKRISFDDKLFSFNKLVREKTFKNAFI